MKAILTSGMQFHYNDRLCEVISWSSRIVLVLDLLSKAEIRLPEREILEGIEKGKIKIINEDAVDNKRLQPNSKDLQAYDKEKVKKAELKYNMIKALENNGISSITKSTQEEINSIAKSLNTPPPSWRTVCRWKKMYIESGRSIRSLIDLYENCGGYERKKPELQEIIGNVINDVYLTQERISLSETHRQLKTIIKEYNQKNGTSLTIPSYSTLQREVNRIPPYEIKKRREGIRKAKEEFRETKFNQPPERVLQRAEADHTTLDYFLLDDKTLLPMGRPYITVILDKFSRVPLGLCISFYEGSYLTVAKALKSALLPKMYIKEQFPNLKSNFPYYGKMQELTVDNAREFWSDDLKMACLDLDININYARVKRGWEKGSIENYFRRQNARLIENIEGKTFSNIFKKDEYDSAKHSVMTFNEFICVFYKWLFDIYPYEEIRVRNGGVIVPHKVWVSSINDVPRVIFSKESLDIILGKTEWRMLKVGGIQVDYIKYDSKELSEYRAKYQNNEQVLIKYNPEDMGLIFVLNKASEEYFSVPAIDQDYADGLTYWQHKIIRRYAKEKMKLSNREAEDLHAAKVELNLTIKSIIENKAKGKKKISKKIAKFQNISTNEGRKKTKNKKTEKKAKTQSLPIKRKLRNFDDEN
ncbi:Mu transposase C-terminal domain-containing protein [Endozoicomonas euniceicola]|uniref:Mu transposase C-terminal domain-containing protein n=1 Tax=Endozoicomonas euniceicola TaxID=1234143 RepID=A0ABY6GXZ2_9GAMM|nr:Mu transposase C-terminal domain-containing protein [Endozoicomonas euniceicola]UYM17669.1 Mu transposase C-terminal domain-containing protein [Endozoicomonas euniceicola]